MNDGYGEFRKSSTSGPWTDNCIEVAFKTSTRSGNNGACVEVGACDCGVKVRDSKDQTGPVLTFTHKEWDAFVEGVELGEFRL